jgi:hypothetical protein
MEFPLLNTLVYSSLASVQLEYFLQFSLMSARTVDTLAAATWAPTAFGGGHVRNDVYMTLAECGCTA